MPVYSLPRLNLPLPRRLIGLDLIRLSRAAPCQPGPAARALLLPRGPFGRAEQRCRAGRGCGRGAVCSSLLLCTAARFACSVRISAAEGAGRGKPRDEGQGRAARTGGRHTHPTANTSPRAQLCSLYQDDGTSPSLHQVERAKALDEAAIRYGFSPADHGFRTHASPLLRVRTESRNISVPGRSSAVRPATWASGFYASQSRDFDRLLSHPTPRRLGIFGRGCMEEHNAVEAKWWQEHVMVNVMV